LLALRDVLDNGITATALAELETLGGGPNGTGLSVLELKEKYETTQEGTSGGLGDRKPDFDWDHLSKDWNKAIKGKKDDDGNWKLARKEGDRRKDAVNNFIWGIFTAKERERVEILAVGHGSIFKHLLGLDRTGMSSLYKLCSRKTLSAPNHADPISSGMEGNRDPKFWTWRSWRV
jgi:hypothetical protein